MEEGQLKNTFRLRLLWGLSGLMGVGGLIAVAMPLAFSMFPSKHDLYVDIAKNQMVLPLDIDAMEPNRVYRIDNIGASVCVNRVYVIKRTDEQIRFLRQHPNIKPIDRQWESYDQPDTRNVLRSVRPDVFVFGVLGGGDYIRVSRRYYNDIILDQTMMTPRKVHFRNDKEFLGAITLFDPSNIKIEEHANTYDLAGRSVAGCMDPLMIPPHFYDNQGRLVLGWRVSENKTVIASHRNACLQWYK